MGTQERSPTITSYKEPVDDLEGAMPEEDSVHDLLLGSPALFIGNQVILGGFRRPLRH
ncbi:hypothetical protein [Streptomyces lydicus]|uniref:hypothetical protein n=1 Tax=Streptomyces lydicus TaxID=47763 RepID=UPI0036CC4720